MLTRIEINSLKKQAQQIMKKNIINIILIQIIPLVFSNLFITIFTNYYLSNHIDEGTLLIINYLCTIFIAIPLSYGVSKYLYNCTEDKQSYFDLVSSFKDGYIKIIATVLISSLLLVNNIIVVVITIILSFIFMYSDYILIKYSNLCFADTISKCLNISKNNRINGVLIEISFIPLLIVSCILFFIPLIYVIPYIQLTKLLYIKEQDMKLN